MSADRTDERPSPLLPRALWALTVVNVVVGGWLWMQGTDPGVPPSEGDLGGAIIPGSDGDPKTIVVAPPVPGLVDPIALDEAIERGTQAYLELFIRPWIERAEQGGVLDYTHPTGDVERLGPDVYVQCQLYLLVHLLMYFEEMGLPRDHELVRRVETWWLRCFDQEHGRWLWSEEGCLHPKSMIALARLGHGEEFEAAWRWAKQSPLFQQCTRPGLCSIMRSGAIVQTLGPATLSLSGRFEWEHFEKPVPDEENVAKFAYALLEAGRDPDDPELQRMRRALSDFLIDDHVPIGIMNTEKVIGRAWNVMVHQDFRLLPDDGYRISLEVLRTAMKGEWTKNFQLRSIPLFRALFVRALLIAGDRSPEIDAVINGLVKAQRSDGAWSTSTNVESVWSIGKPPVEGYKYGDMDGANTYMVTLALISYREATSR